MIARIHTAVSRICCDTEDCPTFEDFRLTEKKDVMREWMIIKEYNGNEKFEKHYCPRCKEEITALKSMKSKSIKKGNK